MKLTINATKAEIDLIRETIPAEVLALLGIDFEKEFSISQKAIAAFSFLFAPEKGVNFEFEVDIKKGLDHFEKKVEVDLKTALKTAIKMHQQMQEVVAKAFEENNAAFKAKHWVTVPLPEGLQVLATIDEFEVVGVTDFDIFDKDGNNKAIDPLDGKTKTFKMHPRRNFRGITVNYGGEKHHFLLNAVIDSIEHGEMEPEPGKFVLHVGDRSIFWHYAE